MAHRSCRKQTCNNGTSNGRPSDRCVGPQRLGPRYLFRSDPTRRVNRYFRPRTHSAHVYCRPTPTVKVKHESESDTKWSSPLQTWVGGCPASVHYGARTTETKLKQNWNETVKQIPFRVDEFCFFLFQPSWDKTGCHFEAERVAWEHRFHC